jgi:hypothetical protein
MKDMFELLHIRMCMTGTYGLKVAVLDVVSDAVSL